MSSFKGNDGNLMQHWVLCELLAVARKDTTHLTFVDAHSMAPIAIERTEKKANRSGKFDAVLEHLPGQGSSYEQAWQALSSERGTYPNSANFVLHLWRPPRVCSMLPNFVLHLWRPPRVCSMLLCERDKQTVSLLRSWADEQGDGQIEIASGDWRRRFDDALPKQEGLVFISFDPYMFNHHCRKKESGNMYPDDLDHLVDATRSYSKNILLQLSTYDTNDGNSQGLVRECIRSKLEPSGFEEVAIIKPNGKMMSLLYQRHVAFSEELTALPGRFQKWFAAIGHRT